MCFVWLAAQDLGGIIGFAVVYGPASGALVSTITAVVACLTQNMNEIGARTSLLFGIVALAGLAGTPVSGMVATHGKGGMAEFFKRRGFVEQNWELYSTGLLCWR